jgi:predicted ATPase/class 3 adenylate cyclase/DNA-binding XRE family transcriptional regulator
MSDIISLGLWIKRRRKALDLTQDALAALVGCSKELIVKIEGDARRPSREIATLLATQLQLAPEEREDFIRCARAELTPDRLPPPSRSVPRATFVPAASATARPPTQIAPSLPSGTVTFLFTDIAGSTQLWEQHPQAMPGALARHEALLRQAIGARGGVVVKSTGDGMHAVFARATDGVLAALAAQRSLAAEAWGPIGLLRVRMALHTGVTEERDGDYFGPPLNRVARLLAAGHGGQTLLSLATAELVREQLPPDADLRDLGVHRLKDLTYPEQIFQLVAPDLPTTFPPLNSLDLHRTNLPAQPTLLIGRDQEVAAVCALLRGPEVRLLTLTGPGGTGKTRLGLQVAAELLDAFVDGIYFVDLAPIRDANLVVSTIAQTLGLTERGDQPLLDRLRAYLRDKRLLLLLDNFEQVVDAAPVVAELLAACPQLKVLVTSRTPLQLRDEQQFPVPPLALPDLHRLPKLAALSQYAAVALFIQRARAVQLDFAVTNATAPALAEICHRLDGLPLAIELAATRVKLLPLPALLARLDNRLKLLTGGARDLPIRQQTIRATIAWSYDLLTAAEQRLFRYLSVFVGGCTLESAEAVCNELNIENEISILDGLATLVDTSLLRRGEGADSEPRCVMSETIREYALEQLEASGEVDSVRQRQAAYLLALTERASQKFSGSAQVVRLARTNAEYANLWAVLVWAAERGAIEIGVRLVLAWELLWRSHVIEGRRWFETFLPHRSSLPLALQVRVLSQAGNLATMQGDYPGAQALLAESLALARGLGDKPGIATALDLLGFMATAQGHYRQVLEFLEESRALFQELGDMGAIAVTLIRLGEVMSLQGDYARAVALCQESLTLAQERDDTLLVGWAFYALGTLAQRQAEPGQARAWLAKSLPVFQEAGDTIGIAAYLESMAEVVGLEGQPERLVRLFGAVASLRIRFGGAPYSAEQAAYQRLLLAARGQLGEGAYAVAWAAGQALTLEQAIAEALGASPINARSRLDAKESSL